MALQCQVTCNTVSAVANQSPSPMATLTVYNPNAVAVAVTGIQMQFFNELGQTINAAGSIPVPAMGPGLTTVVPALSSITFGPFPAAIAIAGSANGFYSVPAQTTSSVSLPVIPQSAEPPQRLIEIGAVVTGSDLSINNAGRVGVLWSYANPPPVGFQGGALSYANPNNTILGIVTGVL